MWLQKVLHSSTEHLFIIPKEHTLPICPSGTNNERLLMGRGEFKMPYSKEDSLSTQCGGIKGMSL